MRKLEVDFQDVAFAMESHGETEWYLDLETGEVIPVADETLTGEIDEDLEDEMESNPERYEPVPTLESYEGYNDMAAFAGTVKDPALVRLLEVALDGKGAFRRFKDVLLDYPKERERWFRFKEERMEARIREWFVEDLQIEPVKKKLIP